MPNHLLLSDPASVPTRRARTPPRPPERNPHRHGGGLVSSLSNSVTKARQIRITEGVDPALVFKVRAAGRLSEDQWRQRGLELLTEGEEWNYVVLSPGVEPPAVGADLTQYAAGPDEDASTAPLGSFFAYVESFEPYGPEDRLPDAVAATLDHMPGPADIIIWPAENAAQATHRVDQVVSAIARLGGTVTAQDRRPRSPVVRAVIDGAAARELATVPVVELLRLPGIPYVDPSEWRDARGSDLTIERRDGPPIGVLDDAIATGHPLLRDGVVLASRSFPESRSGWQQLGEHGTMVAGLAAYGDFEQPLRDGVPLVLGGPLVQGRVIELDPDGSGRHRFPPEQSEYRTVEQAIAALNDDYGIRVFVLTVNKLDPYAGPHVDLMTESIDNLARERNLVITISTGNHLAELASAQMASGHHAANDYAGYALDPMARVAEPGTAALALTVGSIARSDGPATLAGTTPVGYKAIAPVDGVSPFTRSGPGAFKGNKPDLVHYGGNWVIRRTGELAISDAGTSSISLAITDTGRLFGHGNGTSYAAPRVARVAADVLGAYPDASANLVRALVALSASVPGPVTAEFADKAPLVVGQGLPRAERAVASSARRVVLMGDFEMDTDTVAIHALPIPSAFHRGRGSRTIRVALAFDPPVRRTRREYLAGEMTFDLVRASTLADVTAAYQGQIKGKELKLPKGRLRLDLKPGSTTTANSTLMVRKVRHTIFPEDDGDTYFLAVTHRNRPWARDGVQTYAVAVELEEHAELDVDLYVELQQRVGLRTRTRVRR